ncbi:hypothetical protein Tco_0008115 [Tanacetum coccineum]
MVQRPSQILLTRSLDNPDGIASIPDAVSTFSFYRIKDDEKDLKRKEISLEVLTSVKEESKDGIDDAFNEKEPKERRDEKKRLDHLKQDQTMLVIKRFSERKKVIIERKKTGKIRAKRRDDFRVEVDVRVLEEEVVPKIDDVSLVDGVFNGAFGGEGEKDVVMGEGVVVTSSSLEMLRNSCLGGIMVSLIFLEGLEEEA